MNLSERLASRRGDQPPVPPAGSPPWAPPMQGPVPPMPPVPGPPGPVPNQFPPPQAPANVAPLGQGPANPAPTTPAPGGPGPAGADPDNRPPAGEPQPNPWSREAMAQGNAPGQVNVPGPGSQPTERPQVAEVNVALERLKERAADELFKRIGSRMADTTLSDEKMAALARTELSNVIDAERVPLTSEQRKRLISEIADDVLGHGPLQRYLDDPAVTEIMVNGPEMIYVEHNGKLTRAPSRFTSEAQLRRVIERIVTRVGRRIDESSPLVDARLPDGSRVNAVIPPLAFNGASLTIRKFSKDPFGVNDLIKFGTLTPEMAHVLSSCVNGRLNIIVSGGTGTGKTTLLNVLSSFIPRDERIITIEDAVELQLQQEHVVRLESRPANVEGKGEVTIRDLVRNSLRMRPDRIVVGEVRGGESLDMLQAMNTGHDGSLSTVHANSPRDAIARLETLVLMAGVDLPLRAIREQIVSAVDLIVQLSRLRDGSRRITAVTEVHGIEGQTVTLQDIFLFDFAAGVDPSGRFLGRPRPTGIRPKFVEHLNDLGIVLPPGMFGGPVQGMDR